MCMTELNMFRCCLFLAKIKQNAVNQSLLEFFLYNLKIVNDVQKALRVTCTEPSLTKILICCMSGMIMNKICLLAFIRQDNDNLRSFPAVIRRRRKRDNSSIRNDLVVGDG